MARPVDLVIAGAGMAGLALARALAARPRGPQRVILADPGLGRPVDKTICLWGPLPRWLRPLIRHHWDHLEVAFPGWRRLDQVTGQRYHALSSAHYTEQLLNSLMRSPRFDLRAAPVQVLGQDPSGLTVAVGGQVVQARRLVWATGPARSARRDAMLLQHFRGWEVETERPAFDPQRATLMDFAVPQAGGPTFAYVLPFSPTRALVEWTVFSQAPWPAERYDAALGDYVSQRFGAHRVRRVEAGVLPMSLAPAPPHGREIHLGAGGGMIRPSTGYAFRRSLQQATAVATALARGRGPGSRSQSPLRFRMYDHLMLHALRAEGPRGWRLFEALFRHNSVGDVLRFMGEQTRPLEELRMFGRLPVAPFARGVAPAWRSRRLALAAP